MPETYYDCVEEDCLSERKAKRQKRGSTNGTLDIITAANNQANNFNEKIQFNEFIGNKDSFKFAGNDGSSFGGANDGVFFRGAAAFDDKVVSFKEGGTTVSFNEEVVSMIGDDEEDIDGIKKTKSVSKKSPQDDTEGLMKSANLNCLPSPTEATTNRPSRPTRNISVTRQDNGTSSSSNNASSSNNNVSNNNASSSSSLLAVALNPSSSATSNNIVVNNVVNNGARLSVTGGKILHEGQAVPASAVLEKEPQTDVRELHGEMLGEGLTEADILQDGAINLENSPIEKDVQFADEDQHGMVTPDVRSPRIEDTPDLRDVVLNETPDVGNDSDGGGIDPRTPPPKSPRNSAARRAKIKKLTEQYFPIPLHWERIKAKGPPPPEDTYQLSDGYENSEDSPDRSIKKVPAWCETWVQEFQKQSSIDPDTVFGGVMRPVDLSDVFPKSTKKYILAEANRPPDESWQRDKLRKEEVQNYRGVMGQTERRTDLWENK